MKLHFLLMVFPEGATSRDESDEELMDAFRDGDVSAFATLMERHERKVYNFIFRYVRHPETANDLLQETFLRVVKGATSYRKKARFTTWLFTIARNQCIDSLRKAKFRRTASLDQPTRPDGGGRSLLEKIPGRSPDGLTRTDAHQVTARIEQALRELGEAQREVFVMREFVGMPFKEIAAVVGVSENTIKSRMRYALEKLRLALADFAPDLPGDVDPLPAGRQA